MMKNYLLKLELLAVGALCFSCSNEQYPDRDYSHPSQRVLAFQCQALWNNNQLLWNDDSQIGLFCDQTSSVNLGIGMAAISSGESQGLFYSKIPWTSGEHTFYLYSPYNKDNTTKVIGGNLTDVQMQRGTTADHIQTNSLMYAKGVSEAVDQPIHVSLHHAFGFIDFEASSAAKYQAYKVKSIKLSNQSGIALTGVYSFDLERGTLGFIGGNSQVTLRVADGSSLTEVFHGYVAVNTAALKDVKCDVEVIIQQEGKDDIVLTGEVTPGENITQDRITVVALALDGMASSSVEDNSIDLSKNASANCYVAGVAGQTYRFDATVMGNGYTTPATPEYAGLGSADGIVPAMLNPQSAQILWQTGKSLISDVKLKDGYIYFTTNGSESTPLTEGNAVIAAYSDKGGAGSILWSWHIWVTKADLDGDTQTYAVHNDYVSYSNYLSPQMMDRNLGALNAGIWATNNDHSSHGLHYQWGRKDPFIGVEIGGSQASTNYMTTYDKDDNVISAMASSPTLNNAAAWRAIDNGTTRIPVADIAKYPMNFVLTTGKTDRLWLEQSIDDLWGNPYSVAASNVTGHKSIYDPCPPGYRVPHPYVWSGFTSAAAGGATSAVTINLVSGTISDATTIDGGIKIQNASAVVSYPCNGFIALSVKAPLQRVGNNAASYWCNMPVGSSNDVAYVFYFDKNNFNTPKNNPRIFGYGVRCMKE